MRVREKYIHVLCVVVVVVSSLQHGCPSGVELQAPNSGASGVFQRLRPTAGYDSVPDVASVYAIGGPGTTVLYCTVLLCPPFCSTLAKPDNQDNQFDIFFSGTHYTDRGLSVRQSHPRRLPSCTGPTYITRYTLFVHSNHTRKCSARHQNSTIGVQPNKLRSKSAT